MKRRWLKWLLIGIAYPVVIFVTYFVTTVITSMREQSYLLKKYDTLTQFYTPPDCPLFQNYLNLSKSQKEEINSIGISFQTEAKTIRNQLREEKNALLRLLLHPEPDTILIMKKINEIAIRQADLEKNRIKEIIKIKEILTTTQQAKFASDIKKAVCPWD